MTNLLLMIHKAPKSSRSEVKVRLTRPALIVGLVVFTLSFVASCSKPVRQTSAPVTPAAGSNTLTGRVVRIADGDTITVLDATNAQHRIRLQGIDAPESHQAFGTQSKKNLSNMIFDQEVTVEYEKTDQYGRIVGKI